MRDREMERTRSRKKTVDAKFDGTEAIVQWVIFINHTTVCQMPETPSTIF